MDTLIWVGIAFTAGGIVGCVAMGVMAGAGMQDERERHKAEQKAEYDRGYYQGQYDAVVRKIFAPLGVCNEQA